MTGGWRYTAPHRDLHLLFWNAMVFGGSLMACSPLITVLMLRDLGFPPVVGRGRVRVMSCLVSTNAKAGSENRRSGSTARITAGLGDGRQHSSDHLFIRCDPPGAAASSRSDRPPVFMYFDER